MQRHHEQAIDRYVARTAGRQEVLGILLTGSLASGTARPDSDVDLVVVVTDEAWQAAVAAERIMVVEHDGAGYEGGYFDVKLATIAQLDAAAQRGDDPVRHSLGVAEVLYDQGFRLSERLAAIRAGAEAERTDLVAAFVAQARIHGEYFLVHALDHDQAFLTAHAAVHLALAAGRGLLASADVLHPGPKDLVATVRALPDPGPRFAAAMDAVTRSPSAETAAAVLALVEEHLGHVLLEDSTLSRFVLDNELAWYTGRTPPELR